MAPQSPPRATPHPAAVPAPALPLSIVSTYETSSYSSHLSTGMGKQMQKVNNGQGKMEEPGSLRAWLTREWASPRVSLPQDFLFRDIIPLMQLTDRVGNWERSVLADADI